MADTSRLNHPWLIAVWPGMGHVALSVGYYLMSKLGMHELTEFPASDLFDINHVDVKGGRIQKNQRPRSRLFLWNDPNAKRDIVLFIGEAQPPLGKYAFCERLLDYALQFGIERIFTFAAMATPMHPEHESRVFAAATTESTVEELKKNDLHLLEEGQIGGLNGVFLGAVADRGLDGICLLGEMPHVLAQLPFPKASLAALKRFTEMAGITVDFTELRMQSDAMDQRLGEVLSELEKAMAREQSDEQDEFVDSSQEELNPNQREIDRIEQLFADARRDRSHAYELKRELDRLGIFDKYEDEFLDLFKKPD